MATKKPRVAAPAAIQRRQLSTQSKSAGNYFANSEEKTGITFVSTGCALLDAALGGGYALGRVVNVVGDKSSGKTLQAMELAANFARQFPEGWIRYAESEAAFDEAYAGALGIPLDRIEFNKKDQPMETVENLYDDLVRCLDDNQKVPQGLYIIDSLDALSDDDEMAEDFDKGSYGGKKPKAIGKLFRMLVERLKSQNVILLVVSQIRDKIGVTFGETKTRSGGKALDFYATHIVWLAEIGKIKKTQQGVERVVGVNVRAKVKKNKVGLPFRECDYPILFGYGIDDVTAGLEWLIEIKKEDLLTQLGFSKAGYKVRAASLRDKGGQAMADVRAELTRIIHKEWARIETGFLPTSRKY